MGQLAPFALERYFARHEFSARYLLSSSDCESLPMAQILALADEPLQLAWDSLRLGYTESAGHPWLRQSVAAEYDGLSADQVLSVVPEEGIFLLMHALLQPGDHVVCTFPGYQSLYEIPRALGCQLALWQPVEEGRWRFEPDGLAAALRPETKLVVLNFPHNPTGCLPSTEEFLAMIDRIRRQGAYLLSDEMYRLLELEPGTTLPPACQVYERAITLSGLSKAYGLPGLRLGWLATQDGPVLERLRELKDYTTICGGAPSEILGIIALRKREAILQEQRARIRRNLDTLEAFVGAYEGLFAWRAPAAGSVCFPRLELEDDSDIFCRRLIEEAGIMLLPSSQFQFGSRHVRIGYGREDLAEVLRHFGDHLRERYPARWKGG